MGEGVTIDTGIGMMGSEEGEAWGTYSGIPPEVTRNPIMGQISFFIVDDEQAFG
jgi:hypothetical protein